MPTEIAIQDEQAQKALKRLMERIKEVGDGGRAFGMALSAVVFQDVMDHFEKEEGPDGKWHPWSQMYRRLQDARGKGGNKLLQDTGRLRQSFLPTNFRKVGEGIMWFNPAQTADGFPYAYHHNEGAANPRVFMWTSEEASEKIAEITLEFVLKK